MDDYSKFLDELKQRASIVEVVSSYAQLVRKSGHYWACCPLHVEKTPSFKLDEARNTYHCFGCGKHGDVISFIEDIEKTDFNGAVEILARKYNLDVPKRGKDPKSNEHKKKRDRLYDLANEAARFYHENLISSKGEKALEYLNSRGITMRTIKKFGLGYCTNKYDLINHLKQKGFTEEEMVEAKVAYAAPSKKAYDPQFERFITPIINSTNNVIAFGGRIIEKKDDTVAKYYNSMDSFIFHKSKELFGQHILKKIRNVDHAILVEGYMDVITLYQAGIENAVASMGTALTEDQARLLKRFVSRVYYMYDGDAAGQKGMLRGVDILKNAGLDVYCVVLENNLDPDEYIKKFGVESMKKLIYQKAVPMYQYKINSLAKNYSFNSPEERGTFAAEAINLIKDITLESQIEPILQFISDKTAITYNSLKNQFVKVNAGKAVSVNNLNANKVVSDKMTKALRFIIYAAFGGVDGIEIKDEYADCIQNPELMELYTRYRQDKNVTLEDFEEFRETNSEVLKIEQEAKKIDQKIAKAYFMDCRKYLLLSLYEEKKKQLLLELNNIESEEDKQLIYTQIGQINSKIKEIK